MNNAKKILNTVSSIFVWALVVFAICMTIFTVFSVTTFDKTNRSVFGFHFFVVMSDSMSASDLNAGDIAIVKEVSDPSTLKEGDIISYTSTSSESFGETITHMIRKKTTDKNGNPAFVTFGTTTNTDDRQLVTYPYVIGKCVARFAKIGTFFQFLKTMPGYVLCILLPFLIIILYRGFVTIDLFRKYKKEQEEEMNEERKQIDEERKQTLAMMQEIQALREQLANQTKESAQPSEEPPKAE